MLRLSEEIGQHVWTADGERIGKLVDLTILHGASTPVVHHLVVRTNGRLVAVQWNDVSVFTRARVEVQHGVAEIPNLGELELAPIELRLGRDVLDAQIVDLTGHHLVRVGDVLLTRRDDDTLTVVGVDVGFAAVARRLAGSRLSRRFAERIVPWSELHLLSQRGHKVQLESRSAHLHRLAPDDLALLLERLSPNHADEVLETLPPEKEHRLRRLVARASHGRRRRFRSRHQRRWHALPDDEPAAEPHERP